MEESPHQVQQNNPSYWRSVLVAMLVVGFVASLMPIIFGYLTIGLEPSGSMVQLFIPVIGICFGCLVGAMGGFTSIWHYSKTYNVVITLAKGALIGFLTGVAIAAFGTIVDQLIFVFDPDFNENLRERLIAIIEATDLPDNQKQLQIDNIANQYSAGESFWGILISFIGGGILYGILNLITGMIGAKIFGKKEEIG